MTEQLLLVIRNENGDIDTFDLMPYAALDGWAQNISPVEDGFDHLDEVITLHFTGYSDDNLATIVQDLDDFLKRSRWYSAESTEGYGLWLRAQLPGETAARQAFIADNKRGKALVLSPYIDEHVLRDYQLGLIRVAGWEATSATQYTDTIDALGDMIHLASIVPGDIPQRIFSFSLFGRNGFGGPMTRFWYGFRTTRFGDPTNFVPIWEVELGTLGTDTATTTANDATASGVSPKSIRCTFATVTTLVERCRIKAITVSPTHYVDQRGRFIILGRFKCTDGSTQVRVQLKSAFASSITWFTSPRQLVSGTDWNIWELGEVQIPQVGRFISSDQIAQATLRIDAELIAGSGSLDIDCLVLIPTAEGFVYLNGGSVQYTGGATQVVAALTFADGEVKAYGTTAGLTGFTYSDIQVSIEQGIPVGDVYMIGTAARATSHVITDSVLYLIQAYSRWLTLRGTGTGTPT